MTAYSVYGVGQMGSEIAKGLIRRGEVVTIHDPIPPDSLLGETRTLADAARLGDVHLICVRGAEVARDVLLGGGGVLDNASPRSLILLMTTMSPIAARSIISEANRRGFGLIADAAMSRRLGAISERSLTILLGCDQSVADSARRACEAFADNIVIVGNSGMGMSAKLVNNWILQSNRAALIGATRAAVALGIDAERIVDVVRESSGSSWVSGQWGETERALLIGAPVDRALARRTEDEVNMLFDSLRSVNFELEASTVGELIATMKGLK